MAPDMHSTDEDAAAIDMASELMRARQQIPPPERSEEALTRLLAEVEVKRMNPGGNGTSIIGSLLGGSRLRRVMAVVAAAGLVGGAGLGVAAATGNEPVRNLLGISSTSAIKVEFEGVVVDVTSNELRVDAGGDLRVVVLDAGTRITRSGDDVGSDVLLPGAVVEVHGRLLPDNSIVATRVNIEDDGLTPTSPPATVEPTAPATVPPDESPTVPVAQPTVDEDDDHDDDGQDDDNQGPGSGDDGGNEDDDGDRSGPGGGDDDGDDSDDNSGPGSPSSGPGGGDDGGGDDSGDDGPDDDGGDDDTGDDSSGSGGGDDDGDDE